MTTKICYTKVSTNEKLFEKRTQVKNKHVLKDNVVNIFYYFLTTNTTKLRKTKQQ